MTKTYRFALIGCGVISRTHAEQISAIENAELVAVVDRNEAKMKRLAAEYNVDGYVDYHEMLKREDIDVVNILTPSGMHSDMAIACANAGKHVITEKPMDVNIEKAHAMINVCKEQGVKLAVISQHRFDPATVQVKRAIEEERLGKLILGQAAVNWYRSQEYYDSGEWRGTWELDGGGALMNQSIHTIDLLQYLMGPITQVEAKIATLTHERIEVEDIAVATVRFANGGLGTIVGTTSAYPGLSARLELFGTTGSAKIEDDELLQLFVKPDSSNSTPEDAINLASQQSGDAATGSADPGAIAGNAHRLQIEDMIEALEAGREPIVNGEEGLKPLEIILSIYESAQSRQPKTVQ
ncbi:Gfo/Idh/MocA family protein [Pontibacillus salicampi]